MATELINDNLWGAMPTLAMPLACASALVVSERYWTITFTEEPFLSEESSAASLLGRAGTGAAIDNDAVMIVPARARNLNFEATFATDCINFSSRSEEPARRKQRS